MEFIGWLWMVQVYWTRVDDRSNKSFNATVFKNVEEAVKNFKQLSREAIDDLAKGYEGYIELYRVNAETQDYQLIWESHYDVMTEGKIS
ncbi:MAG: hypothetical protein J6U54_15950 [Clostridiales bacterium]|nr:hypothetical protein [Clostridiales bacterium]